MTRLNREVARLGKQLAREEQASERRKETIRRQYDEDIQLRAALRRLRDQSDRVRSLSEEVFWLRIALDGAKAGKEAIKAKLAKLFAEKEKRCPGPSRVLSCVRRSGDHGTRSRRSSHSRRRFAGCAGPCGRWRLSRPRLPGIARPGRR